MNSLSPLFRRLAFGFCAALCVTAVHAESAPSYKVGATASGSPFTFLDIKSNSIQGVMVDVAQAVGKAGGFTSQIEQTNFAALIPSLTSGKLDFIAAGMLKTEERTKVVDFSAPVYAYGEGLIVRADDNAAYPDLTPLKGQVVGVQAGTIFYDQLNKLGIFKEIRTYDSIGEMVRDLSLGRIKAAVGDQPVVAYQISQKLFKGVKLAPDYVPTHVGDVCLVVRKGDAQTLERLNTAIASIKADGTLNSILKKWGLEAQVTP
ncbi:ABC transporter substrate-binding protein [Pseudomonas extremaustralis]|jgi:polar amino acid transport system substrate-binding protein|uniref:Amino acid ABC transporter substrate-binding protein n=1 Tax=Pseudomonas extremaustralis TaxID=359110 RepID=A0A5C5QCJ9_9PSED|nr:ABC transporter substrate-binding protein [Pseudomonas extremaustralis]EZI28291.1 ABC transporter substrate-binding protein [Pseudomonas extremaustralis 14-3 substr. 14-3b]TWS03045.1 amino acid ABC transporter substrate-binding protein [Pseudomonas extremaustralis]SDE83925.1 polar amino acid transport system substrate-binding protein [Pseudomonas extremaustralis]SKA90084.1 polar amino acid transport system substrate-binding protein [Pseudomonas extremaustralis]